MKQQIKSDRNRESDRYPDSSGKSGIRLQFEMTQVQIANMQRLIEELSFGSRRELVNNAISLFKYVFEQRKRGLTLAAVDANSKIVREIVVPAFEEVLSEISQREGPCKQLTVENQKEKQCKQLAADEGN
jgi:hypothetical protein